MLRALIKSLCADINKETWIHCFIPNFSALDPTTTVCTCLWLPRALFSKSKKWVPTFPLPPQGNGPMRVTLHGGTVRVPVWSWAEESAPPERPVCHLPLLLWGITWVCHQSQFGLRFCWLQQWKSPAITAPRWVFPFLQPGSNLNLYHLPRHLKTYHFPQICYLQLLSLCFNPNQKHERLVESTGGVRKAVVAVSSYLLFSGGSCGCLQSHAPCFRPSF